ncbi:MAG: phosphatase PAP2 family protein [Sphingomonas bacterium]|nr:phosphatase PAP2 family protein [Sphingomonas bacterium]
MSHFSDRTFSLAAVVVALLMFVMAGVVGGPDYGSDVAAIHSLAVERSTHAGLTGRAIFITHFGGAEEMVTILLIALALLVILKRWRSALVLAGIVLGGRMTVELLKLLIDRPRPSFTPYPVEIVSLSFPSGHSANSMITFLALALIVAPVKYRMAAVGAAILASAAIGATRPLLGVHWPSDVIGGWAFGIAWVVALVELSQGWRGAAKK